MGKPLLPGTVDLDAIREGFHRAADGVFALIEGVSKIRSGLPARTINATPSTSSATPDSLPARDGQPVLPATSTPTATTAHARPRVSVKPLRMRQK
jgi:hypothetical protein